MAKKTVTIQFAQVTVPIMEDPAQVIRQGYILSFPNGARGLRRELVRNVSEGSIRTLQRADDTRILLVDYCIINGQLIETSRMAQLSGSPYYNSSDRELLEAGI